MTYDVKKALKAVKFCLSTISSARIPKNENAIWSCGTSSKPRITEDILETICQSLQRNEWQPIETAPKDGTRVQLWMNCDAWFGQWYENNAYRKISRWNVFGSKNWKEQPTHWMPLPLRADLCNDKKEDKTAADNTIKQGSMVYNPHHYAVVDKEALKGVRDALKKIEMDCHIYKVPVPWEIPHCLREQLAALDALIEGK